MNPKALGETPEPQQGELFQAVRPGTTEPDQLSDQAEHYKVAPEGTFPDVAQTIVPEVDPATHRAAVTARRHTGQLGKHSPLERTGSYSDDLRVGDVLPGFGPVTYANRNAAEQYAQNLDNQRSTRH